MASSLEAIGSTVPRKDTHMREPKRREEHKKSPMRGEKDKKMMRSKPDNPGDPERKKGGKGDGMKMATMEKAGTEKGRPEKGKQPSLRSDGMKVAMRGEKGASKLSKMPAAEQRVR